MPNPSSEEEFDAIFKRAQARLGSTPAPTSEPSAAPWNQPTKLTASPNADLKMLDYRDAAREDMDQVMKLHPKLKKAADRYAVPVEILAGMASRESRGGKALNKEGYDPDKKAFGVLQVDEDFHKRKGKTADSMEHIDQAAGILREYRNAMDRKHPEWSDEDRWRGAVAAYNMGPGNVKTRKNLDKGTTGGDYSKDVMHRAEFFGAQLAAKEEKK